MKWRFLHGMLVLFLVAACSKESDSEAPGGGDQPGKQRRSVRAISGGDGEVDAGESKVGNSYAEKHWPAGEEVANEWTEEFEAAETPDGKIAVVERKQSSGPELLAPLIRRSLREPDERVRTEAVKMVKSFAGTRAGAGAPAVGIGNAPGSVAVPDEVVDLVVGATYDPTSEVRTLAMEAALELELERQIEIYRMTIEAPDSAVRKMTITELGRMMSKPAFEVLITGLQNSDPAFREQVNFEVNLLVNRKFDSFEEAAGWWGGNAAKFSDNMIDLGGSE